MNNGSGNGAAAFQPDMIDLHDPKQRWVLLYEDRKGGYIGRLIAKDENKERYLLTDGFCFSEGPMHGTMAAPADQEGKKIHSLIGQWQIVRDIWPLGMNAESATFDIPIDQVISVVFIATLNPLLRRVWAQAYDSGRKLRTMLLQEAAAGGKPPLITLADELPKGGGRS